MSDAWQWFQLEPVDTCFFRDGYPFNAGEDQSIRSSVFPPHPPTIVGTLRAALARARGWNGKQTWNERLTSVLGNGFDDLGTLSFQGPFLYKDGSLLFSMPQCVAGYVHVQGGARRFKPEALLGPSENVFLCDAGAIRLPVLPTSTLANAVDKLPAFPEDFYLTCAGMERVLAGMLPRADDCIPAEMLYNPEPRIAIKRGEETRTTGEASMYAPRHIRLRPGVSLAAGIQGLPSDWTIPNLMPMGGESRLVVCTPISSPPVFPKGPDTPSKKHMVLLLSPAWFQDSVWWGAGPSQSARKLHDTLKGSVVSAAIGRPVGIGGWDSLKHAPLPMHPCVAPGAVWWLDGEKEAVCEFGTKQIGNRAAYGFGTAVIGVWT